MRVTCKGGSCSCEPPALPQACCACMLHPSRPAVISAISALTNLSVAVVVFHIWFSPVRDCMQAAVSVRFLSEQWLPGGSKLVQSKSAVLVR
jgi:hypothetical protein